MRILRLVTALGVASAILASGVRAHAQVNDAERAAARELFKQGDELQRAGHFAEALDKFERAQQTFSAPTNLLRIAECNAALGRLVESAEGYRTVARISLPAGSPPAFQAAVDQAKAELEQVEPRIPRVVVQVQPAVSAATLQIDGQSVPTALLGEPIPLDPGTHRVGVVASGYGSSDQVVSLKERETRSVVLSLTALAPAPPLPAPAAAPPAGAAPAPPSPPPPYPPPPPPPPPPPGPGGPLVAAPAAPPSSRTGLLVGVHLGGSFLTGKIPVEFSDGAGFEAIESSSIASGGVAYGADGAFRFARHWVVGLVLEHANYGAGNLDDFHGTAASVSSDTTLVGLNFGFIGNPDRTSFYGELGLANRWFHYSIQPTTGTTLPGGGTFESSHEYSNGEFTLGLGIWIPIGRSFRLLPKATVGIGPFDIPGETEPSNPPVHTFVMVGVEGLYNLDF
jgi:hypothetical protein